MLGLGLDGTRNLAVGIGGQRLAGNNGQYKIKGRDCSVVVESVDLPRIVR